MNKLNGKVTFFKYNKQSFSLLELKGSENSFLSKMGGGCRYKDKDSDFTGLMVDTELPTYKKRLIIHRLIKGKKIYTPNGKKIKCLN